MDSARLSAQTKYLCAALAMLAPTGCKTDADKAAPEVAGPVDWTSVCAGEPAQVPLTTGPLVASIAGQDKRVAAEIGRGGVIVRGDGLRIVIPTGRTPRRAVDLESWAKHLRGRDEPPILRGRVAGLEGPPVSNVLRLELDPMTNGVVEGRISMCLSAPENAVIAGAFSARVAENLSDAPDTSRDHGTTLAYLAERKLGRGLQPTPIKRYFHRGIRLDTDAGTGYDHVVVRRKKTSTHTLTFKKSADGKWSVDEVFPGHQIPEAHPKGPLSDPVQQLVAEVARTVENGVAESRPGATFRSRIVSDLQGKSGKVTVNLVVDDDGSAGKAESMRFTATAELDDAGQWLVAGFESDPRGVLPPLPATQGETGLAGPLASKDASKK